MLIKSHSDYWWGGERLNTVMEVTVKIWLYGRSRWAKTIL